jgi:proline iminopeptidase
MEHGLPAYSPSPFDPNALARVIMNVELQFDFFRDFRMDLTADLAGVRCPTLVLAGALDPITPLATAEEIVAALPPELVTYEVFERSGHLIPDTEPDGFFAAIKSFLGGCVDSGRADAER